MGESSGIERKIAASAGWEFRGIKAGKLRRYHQAGWRQVADLPTLLLNLRDVFRVGAGLGQSLGIIRSFKPDIVFIKGGYVGLPVGWAARLLRVRYVVHESDVLPGLTNRLLAGGASAVAVGFPVRHYPGLPATKLHYTGNPIRSSLLQRHRLEGIAHFKLDAKVPVVLIMGGSQGAQVINRAAVAALPKLLQICQVIHISGERELESIRFEVQRLRLGLAGRYHLFAFLMNDLAEALAASDVVVSRAGANAMAELAALGKPTILVPNPRLVGGHQVINAQVMGRAGAARLLPETKLTPDSLLKEVELLIKDQQEQERLSKAIRKLAVPDAAHKLAQLLIEVAKQ